jgi:RNA polymerase sigma-70 factor, ECF subfamily
LGGLQENGWENQAKSENEMVPYVANREAQVRHLAVQVPRQHDLNSTSKSPGYAPSPTAGPRPLVSKCHGGHDGSLQGEIVNTVPRLRGFAMSLCRNSDRADDLVQETILRALAHIHQFQPGTSLSAWLKTILQNLFRSEYRRRRREVEDKDGYYANNQLVEPSQAYGLEAEEFPDALARLPADQRQALHLVVIAELPYERVAEMCQCPVGTVKSRVNRARMRLSELLEIDEVDVHLWKVRGKEARRKLKWSKARRRLRQPS